jgi:hypothetical protein
VDNIDLPGIFQVLIAGFIENYLNTAAMVLEFYICLQIIAVDFICYWIDVEI